MAPATTIRRESVVSVAHMPLIKLFARLPLKVSAGTLHKAFCKAWAR